MANILTLNAPFVSDGLVTYTYTVAPTLTNPSGAGIYNIKCWATVPSAVGTGGGAGSGGVASGGQNPPVTSSLVILVKQNGTTVYTSPAIAPTQGELRFKFALLCANADVITVVPSSANVNDNFLNTVKMAVAIGNGLQDG
jgi:hypothetical protein